MKYFNILQVDDDPDDCEMFFAALRTISDSHYTAINSPKEAMKRLTSGKIDPDVIILDINMPLINGFDFLAMLKQDAQLCQIPVILFSTSSDAHTKKRALEAGAFQYAVKPDNFPRLQQIIKKIFL